MDSTGFLRSAQALTSTGAQGSRGRSEERTYEGTKRQKKTGCLATRKEKLEEPKVWNVGYLWRKMSCMSWLERAGWRNEAEKFWNVNLRIKTRGTHHPCTLPTMHPSVTYVLYSGRIRDWRCHWPPGVPSPPTYVALHWVHLPPRPKDCVYIIQVICTG